MWTQSVLSTEYVPLLVSATVAGQSGYNPTGDVVQMAFMATGNPGPSDWHTAIWQVYTSSGGAAYVALCLVGPGAGGVPLAVGMYSIWFKVVDSPEVPVRPVDMLQIT